MSLRNHTDLCDLLPGTLTHRHEATLTEHNGEEESLFLPHHDFDPGSSLRHSCRNDKLFKDSVSLGVSSPDLVTHTCTGWTHMKIHTCTYKWQPLGFYTALGFIFSSGSDTLLLYMPDCLKRSRDEAVSESVPVEKKTREEERKHLTSTQSDVCWSVGSQNYLLHSLCSHKT